MIAYLRDEASDYNFSTCMADYAYHLDHHFVGAYDVLNDIIINLKAHPANQFAFLVTDEEKWAELSEQHQGHDYILECMGQHPQKAENKLHRMLFPRNASGISRPDEEDEPVPFSADFSK